MNIYDIAYRDIDKIHSIERQREAVLASVEFQNWCKRYGIGSRVEVRDERAGELMRQYGERYTQWLQRQKM